MKSLLNAEVRDRQGRRRKLEARKEGGERVRWYDRSTGRPLSAAEPSLGDAIRSARTTSKVLAMCKPREA